MVFLRGKAISIRVCTRSIHRKAVAKRIVEVFCHDRLVRVDERGDVPAAVAEVIGVGGERGARSKEHGVIGSGQQSTDSASTLEAAAQVAASGVTHSRE